MNKSVKKGSLIASFDESYLSRRFLKERRSLSCFEVRSCNNSSSLYLESTMINSFKTRVFDYLISAAKLRVTKVAHPSANSTFRSGEEKD